MCWSVSNNVFVHCLFGFRHVAQLVACVITGWLGGISTPFLTCGAHEQAACEKPELEDECRWVKSDDGAVRAKVNEGSCFPRKLVGYGGGLKTQFKSFLDSVPTRLPLHTDIVKCLAKIEGSCANPPGPTCVWCGPVDDDKYGGTPTLRGVCLPTTMNGDFCIHFKATGALTKCAEEVAREEARALLSTTGCGADCAYQPK